jgi:hypothetical protein
MAMAMGKENWKDVMADNGAFFLCVNSSTAVTIPLLHSSPQQSF